MGFDSFSQPNVNVLNFDIDIDQATDVTLGCDNCPNRKTLHFDQAPSAILTGVDTTGLNIKVDHHVSLKFRSNDPNTSYEGNPRGSTSFEQLDFECQTPCEKVDRILIIGENLVRHANRNSKVTRK